MRRALPGGFELDDDPGRVDVDAAHLADVCRPMERRSPAEAECGG